MPWGGRVIPVHSSESPDLITGVVHPPEQAVICPPPLETGWLLYQKGPALACARSADAAVSMGGAALACRRSRLDGGPALACRRSRLNGGPVLACTRSADAVVSMGVLRSAAAVLTACLAEGKCRAQPHHQALPQIHSPALRADKTHKGDSGISSSFVAVWGWGWGDTHLWFSFL